MVLVVAVVAPVLVVIADVVPVKTMPEVLAGVALLEVAVPVVDYLVPAVVHRSAYLCIAHLVQHFQSSSTTRLLLEMVVMEEMEETVVSVVSEVSVELEGSRIRVRHFVPVMEAMAVTAALVVTEEAVVLAPVATVLPSMSRAMPLTQRGLVLTTS